MAASLQMDPLFKYLQIPIIRRCFFFNRLFLTKNMYFPLNGTHCAFKMLKKNSLIYIVTITLAFPGRVFMANALLLLLFLLPLKSCFVCAYHWLSSSTMAV